MESNWLLYGANGFVGNYIARRAVERGLRPILAGRNAAEVSALAGELHLDYRIFSLDDSTALNQALGHVDAVLHCAGPYLYTSRQMVEGCFRTGTHYLDLTGEIPVIAALARRDAEAKQNNIMLMPSVGFDVIPTDCLALYLKQRLPTATQLSLAFQSRGPAGLPPGTQKTSIELMATQAKVRRGGKLVPFPSPPDRREIDFGKGPKQAILFPWADVFTAYYSTGIPDISVYFVMPRQLAKQMGTMAKFRPLAKLPPLRALLKRMVRPGPTEQERAETCVDVWGEVTDDAGQKAVARLHGPEAGVVWTARAALAAIQHVLAGDAPPGFQTPAKAYGPDLVMECPGVTREDVA